MDSFESGESRMRFPKHTHPYSERSKWRNTFVSVGAGRRAAHVLAIVDPTLIRYSIRHRQRSCGSESPHASSPGACEVVRASHTSSATTSHIKIENNERSAIGRAPTAYYRRRIRRCASITVRFACTEAKPIFDTSPPSGAQDLSIKVRLAFCVLENSLEP